MLSREVMKAAEYASSDMKFDRVPRCRDVQVCTDHILAHREDYAEDGTPLEVDEGFARDLGFEGPADEDGYFWRNISSGKVGVDCAAQYPSLLFVDADGDQTIFPAPKTRPQLRALIEAMG
jgi:hypothetical protein